VRLRAELGTIGLAEAVSPGQVARVVVGCDLLGMLGWPRKEVLAAAAALPNRTSQAAQIVLPLAMPGELSGTYLLDGARREQVAAVLPAPKGVPTPEQVIAELARRAGVAEPRVAPAALKRVAEAGPQPAGVPADPPSPAMLLGRDAARGGRDELMAHASWQQAVQPLPELRLSAADAQAMKLKNLQPVTLAVGGKSLKARVRLSPELAGGTMVLSEGFAASRELIPYALDSRSGELVAAPAAASVSP